MSNELLGLGFCAGWRRRRSGSREPRPAWRRALLGLGGVALLALAASALPGGAPAVSTPFGIDGLGSSFHLTPSALWLMGFGLPSAILAAWLGTPAKRQAQWIFGAAASLIGALGVFGMQDAVTFLISWEIMSLGGAVMLLGENLATETGRPALFMLALLEAGAVALLVAFVLLAEPGRQRFVLRFRRGDACAAPAGAVLRCAPAPHRLWREARPLAVLRVVSGAYGSGSGATGAFLSGVVLNAAFFSLSRCLVEWLPTSPGSPVSLPGIFIVAAAVASAILTALYAFQEEGWRELLSLSSAENGSIAVCLLGVALMFRQDGLADLAGLAWTVALLHLAGHALAKGALFLTADGVYRADRKLRSRPIRDCCGEAPGRSDSARCLRR